MSKLHLLPLLAFLPTSGALADGAAISGFALASERGPDLIAGTTKVEKDGAPDWQFTAKIEGEVAALILTICAGGKHTISQWDTAGAGTKLAKDFHWRDGGPTWVLGVASDGVLLNRADGTIETKKHSADKPLQLHAAQNGMLKKGTKVCLSALGADGAVVARAEATL